MPELRWPVVLFDLDGTLANSIDLVVASYACAFASIGRRIDPAVARHWIGETLAVTFARECPADAATLPDVYRAYYEAHIDQVGGYAGVAGLLADLRTAGVTTGVVTAKRRDAATATMAAAGVAGLIDLLGTAEDTAAHKPDPEPLLAAFAKISGARQDGPALTRSDVVYVGDAVHDVLAAQAAGMAAIAVTWGAGVRTELAALHPDCLCDDAAALRLALGRH